MKQFKIQIVFSLFPKIIKRLQFLQSIVCEKKINLIYEWYLEIFCAILFIDF
jgi:hypothetical protein